MTFEWAVVVEIAFIHHVIRLIYFMFVSFNEREFGRKPKKYPEEIQIQND